MHGLTLLVEACRAGLTVTVEGERLVVRGPHRAEPLARQILERKPEVVAELRRRSEVVGGASTEHDPDAGDGEKPCVERCRSCGELTSSARGPAAPGAARGATPTTCPVPRSSGGRGSWVRSCPSTSCLVPKRRPPQFVALPDSARPMESISRPTRQHRRAVSGVA